jgi:hypothetical protein
MVPPAAAAAMTKISSAAMMIARTERNPDIRNMKPEIDNH